MRTGKQRLILFLIIAAATAAYLLYLKEARKQSIDDYFNQPIIGDIYKIEQDDEETNDRLITYYKAVDITPEGIIFVKSRLKSSMSSDIVLRHFQDSEQQFFTHRELKAIRAGEWQTVSKKNTTLIEIIRK